MNHNPEIEDVHRTETSSGQMWQVLPIGGGNSPLVIHVPHAGTLIPSVERARLLLDDRDLTGEIAQMTDWYTDRMALKAFEASTHSGAVFANRLSRLVVDPERLPDAIEPMARIGKGAVYSITSDKRALRDDDPEDDQRLVQTWFQPYTNAFADLIDQKLAQHGRALIVDLHSYPALPHPYELVQSARRPGICIGTDPDHTSAELVDCAVDAFDGVTGGTAENTPFAGTYVPLRHWRDDERVLSIMIEVRRDLYQSEPGGDLHGGYADVCTRLAGFLDSIADASQ